MANEVPATTLAAMWYAMIDGNPVTVQAYDSTHDYVSGVSEYISDVTTGQIGTAEVLVETVTAGDLTVANDAIAGILALEFVDAIIVYADTGIAATSRILAFMDTNADTTDMNKEGDGGNMSLQFPGGLVARI